MTSVTSAPLEPGASIGFFISIRRFFAKVVSWFRQDTLSSGDNESTELMIRAMLPKSWFDKLTHDWVTRSFWNKLGVVSVVVFSFTVIGLFFSAAWILGLSAFFVSLTVHFGLVAHHNQRIAQARNIAAEAITLVQDLEAAQKHLDESVDAVVDVCDKTKNANDLLRHACDALDDVAGHIRETSAEIDNQVEIVVDSTNTLVAAQTTAVQVLEDTSAQAQNLSTVIDESTSALSGVADAAKAFGAAVAQTQTPARNYAAAVVTFGLFVQEVVSRQCINTQNLDDGFQAQSARIQERSERAQARLKKQKESDEMHLSLRSSLDDSDSEPEVAQLGRVDSLGDVKEYPCSDVSFRVH